MSPERKMPSEGREILNHRAILLVVVVAAIGAAVVVGLLAFQQKPSSPPQSQVLNQTSMSQPRGGHLYMQTNETRNAIVHYRWSEKGTLTEVERVATGGAGSGLLSPIYHTKRPNQFEGAGSVILSPDRGFLFTTNGGAKMQAYDPSSSTLFVLHTFGPRSSPAYVGRCQRQTHGTAGAILVTAKDWTNRGPTMAVLSPDGKFLIVGTTFDELPTRKNPDGSLILWIPRRDGKLHVIASNPPDPDGLVVFPVGGDGTLSAPSLYDAKGISQFYIGVDRVTEFVIVA